MSSNGSHEIKQAGIDHSLRKPLPIAWQIVMLIASFLTMVILIMTFFLPVGREITRLLVFFDTALCLLFFSDFVAQFHLAKNRWKYFFTWGWLDLISSIPLFGHLRWGRMARVIRIIRVFRGVRGMLDITRRMLANRRESAFLFTVLLAGGILAFASVSMLVAEQGAPGAKIDTAEDALWWAITTITTVGYGDLVPVTNLGQTIAAFTMIAGITIFGAFTALASALLIRPADEEEEEREEVDKTHVALAEIMERLERIESRLAAQPPDEDKN